MNEDGTYDNEQIEEDRKNYFAEVQRQQFNIWQFDTDELVYIEETLKGNAYDNDVNKWVSIKDIEPTMNERGIVEFINWLRMQLNKKNQLSNLHELSEVYRCAEDLFMSIVEILLINYWKWGLQEEKLEYVYSLVEFPIYAGVLKRAYKGGAMQSVSKTIHAIEQNIMQQQSNKPIRERGL